MSEWQLFTDSPTTVQGHYYFVPADARGLPLVPFLPFPHIYGSREWLSSNFILEQPAQGEVLGVKHRWHNGHRPIRLPLPILVGSPDCVNGSSITSALTPNSPDRYLSWPVGCVPQDPLDDWGWAADVYSCVVELWWARRIIEWEAGETGVCAANLRLRFKDADVRFFPGARFSPPTIGIVHPQYSVVVYDATQTGEQALIEVIEGVLGPTDRGGFSSTLLWYDQATRGLHRLSEMGSDVTRPILLVGYSYGGASAQVGAAICRLASATRHVRWLTFGAPRPGDVRLRELLELPTHGCALANDNDAITAIPPGLDQLVPAQTPLGRVLLQWAQWRPPTETWRMLPNGERLPNVYPYLSTQELVELVQHVWTTGSFFAYPAHSIFEYARRLALRCTEAPAPAAGALGLGIGEIPGVGLTSSKVSLAGKLGIGPLSVAAGKLGLRPSYSLPVHLLGVQAPAYRQGSDVGIGLQAVPAPSLGDLGLQASDVARGNLGLQPGFIVPTQLVGLQAPALDVAKTGVGLGFSLGPIVALTSVSAGIPTNLISFGVPTGLSTGPINPGVRVLMCIATDANPANVTVQYTDTLGTRNMVSTTGVMGGIGFGMSIFVLEADADNSGAASIDVIISGPAAHVLLQMLATWFPVGAFVYNTFWNGTGSAPTSGSNYGGFAVSELAETVGWLASSCPTPGASVWDFPMLGGTNPPWHASSSAWTPGFTISLQGGGLTNTQNIAAPMALLPPSTTSFDWLLVAQTIQT